MFVESRIEAVRTWGGIASHVFYYGVKFLKDQYRVSEWHCVSTCMCLLRGAISSVSGKRIVSRENILKISNERIH
jgi:hypothetical protein